VIYIAQSLDGYIARQDGGIDWLPQPSEESTDDFGWAEFQAGIDAVLMGRKTFETVVGFGGAWPYQKPLTVISSTLKSVPKSVELQPVTLSSEPPSRVLSQMAEKGVRRVYVDGGTLINSLLRDNLMDEMIITTVPVLIGEGIRLFPSGVLEADKPWDVVGKPRVYAGGLVKTTYRRRPGTPGH
jgi:dihydrofolate reductase